MIDYDPIGSITFKGFDDGDRRLSRPKLGQYRWFNRGLMDRRQAAVDKLEALTADADSDDPDVKAAAEAELKRWGQNPVWEEYMDWYRDLFAQLSDRPLPESDDDWPSYFADPALPAQIVAHWRVAPKASNGKPPA